MPGELLNKVQAPRILGVRVILWEMRPQIAVGDRTRQSIDKGMTEHVTI